jgi:hypothetical protein
VIPTLPTLEVERWWSVLHWLHHPLSRPETWALIGTHLVITFGWGGVYARWSVVTVVAAFAAEMVALRVHARLRPWCPWCAGRGPGDAPSSCPAPPPGGLARRPRVSVGPDDSAPAGVGAGRAA